MAEKQAEERTITYDLLCVSCQYNLRTQQIDARCPECGQHVMLSIHDALERAMNYPYDNIAESRKKQLNKVAANSNYSFDAVQFLWHVFRYLLEAKRPHNGPFPKEGQEDVDQEDLPMAIGDLALTIFGKNARNQLSVWMIQTRKDIELLFKQCVTYGVFYLGRDEMRDPLISLDGPGPI